MNRGVSVTAVIALVTALGVSACGKKPPAPAPVPPPPTAPASTPTTPPPPPAPAPPRETPPPALTEAEIFAKKTLAELSGELSPVFFALDSIQLNDAARPVLQKNAD